MKLACWNVNSINSRIGHLVNLLKEQQFDVVLLQELKCEEYKFPKMEIEELGYNIIGSYQKTYNGVAILSKYPVEDVVDKLPELNQPDDQARYIECLVNIGDEAVRIASVYVPNGQDVQSDKYHYKMDFYDRLIKYYSDLLRNDEGIIIAGDFNVANHDIDVYDPKSWEGKICFEINERRKLREFMNLGLYDSYRLIYPNQKQFSWWDYRGNSFNFDKGIRIDYVFANSIITKKLKSAFVDTHTRSLEKPSDHAPIGIEW